MQEQQATKIIEGSGIFGVDTDGQFEFAAGVGETPFTFKKKTAIVVGPRQVHGLFSHGARGRRGIFGVMGILLHVSLLDLLT